MPDPVCIRCGYLDGITVVLVTDTNSVTYNTGGNVIVNTTDISVTNDGLIFNDPGNTFSDDTVIVCTFNQPGTGQVSRTITIEHFCENKNIFLFVADFKSIFEFTFYKIVIIMNQCQMHTSCGT